MNNGKKYLLIGVAVLFILVILVGVLQSALSRGVAHPSPTTQPIPTPFGGGRPNNPYRQASSAIGSGLNPANLSSAALIEKQKKDLISKLPIDTNDFTISYSSIMDKIVVTRKTADAEAKLSVWADQNNYSEVLSDYYDTLVTNQTVDELDAVLGGPTKSIYQESQEQTKALMDLITTMANLPSIFNSKKDEVIQNINSRPTPTPTPSPAPTTSPTSSAGEPKSYNGYVYYSQCHGQYDNYPLAPGCTICRAGCGPTTVAMILSTYVDKKYTPPAVVDIYSSIGAAACGTGLGYAKSVLSSHGVKTSDYIIPYTGDMHDVKEVAGDLRAYINNGWTVFILATYKLANGSYGGHYFWMTDISSSGNVMAFDPYYGMDQTPPINENVRYPDPKYLAAFGVKKQ